MILYPWTTLNWHCEHWVDTKTLHHCSLKMHTSISAKNLEQWVQAMALECLIIKSRQTAWKLIMNKANRLTAGFPSGRGPSYYWEWEGHGGQRDWPPPWLLTTNRDLQSSIHRLLRKPQGWRSRFPCNRLSDVQHDPDSHLFWNATEAWSSEVELHRACSCF